MGFISCGERVDWDDYRDTYYKRSLHRKRTAVRRKDDDHVRHKKRVVVLHRHRESILQRLPLELIYEVYILSDLSDLDKVNRHFHHVLDLSRNRYLAKKFVRHNLIGSGDTLDVAVLDHRFVDLELLQEFDIKQYCRIDRKSRAVIPDYEVDFPSPFYRLQRSDLPLVRYLADSNLKFMDLHRILSWILQHPDWDLSDDEFDTIMAKHSRFDGEDDEDVQVLTLALRHGDFDLARRLCTYYDVEALQHNASLWSFVHTAKSTALYTFLNSLGIHPNLASSNAWNL